MNKDKTYYQNLLRHFEYTQLESVGELLQIELVIYEIRKIIQEIRDLGEYDNMDLDKSKQILGQLRTKHEILANEIEELELDISHAKFMIEILGKDEANEQ